MREAKHRLTHNHCLSYELEQLRHNGPPLLSAQNDADWQASDVSRYVNEQCPLAKLRSVDVQIGTHEDVTGFQSFGDRYLLRNMFMIGLRLDSAASISCWMWCREEKF
jgi:hypothetical protein